MKIYKWVPIAMTGDNGFQRDSLKQERDSGTTTKGKTGEMHLAKVATKHVERILI
jgi:hypothetical protein